MVFEYFWGMNQNVKANQLLFLSILFLASHFIPCYGLQAQHVQGIANKIQEAQIAKVEFKKIDFFKSIKFGQSVSLAENTAFNDLVQMDLNTSSMSYLQSTKPDYMSMSLPLPDGTQKEILLQRVYLYDDNAKLTTQDDPIGIPLTQGVFYQGIFEGENSSIAAISFYENEIIGVVANEAYGNIVIGKKQGVIQENTTSHVIYEENKLPVKNNFHCGVNEIEHLFKKPNSNVLASQPFPNSCKSVKVFLECANRLYTDRNSSKTQVETYITGAFNVVKALYAAESVVMEISEIKVWTTADPYLKTNLADIIYDYANRVRNNFNGTLAQLITTFPIQQQGGIAFVDGMCRTFDPNLGGPHSFAFIFNNYSTLPVYSWTIEVMAHEMGHNFGSWHTHSCVWGPNKDSQIDNCQPADIGSCNNGKAPVGGGTVMSYCHLTGVGINFSKGFGPEPGDVLRNSFNTKACIPTSFTPFTSKVIKTPYYEGDSVRLLAKPYNSKYTYEWLNFDHVFNKKDTAITIKSSGIYSLAVSNVNCTEYAKPDTFIFNDFLVNLGCPVIKGTRDSFFKEVTMEVDNGIYASDSLEFPKGLYSQVPKDARDVHIELQMNIAAKNTSFVRSVVSQYFSPDSLGIKNLNFFPNDNYPFGTRTGFFSRTLGNFDPAGKWKFLGIDTRSDATGYDALVTYRVVISWRMKDSVETCDLMFCDNKPRILDAGILNGKYSWTNGSASKALSVNQEGPIGVTVTRGSYSSSHTVNMIKVNTSFNQNKTICEGENIKIGNRQYDKAGTYSDTLKQVNGCDSVLITVLNVIEKIRTSDTIFRCFDERYNNVKLSKDTFIIESMPGSNGCDSIHGRLIRVNPKINATITYQKMCNNVGADVQLDANGGVGLLKYFWSNNSNDSILFGIKSGTYTVTIEDANGCIISEELKIENYDSIAIAPKISDVKCFGEQNGEIELILTSGTAPFTINWNIGKSGEKIRSLSSGKYTAIIIDANGCRAEQTMEVSSPDLLFVDALVNPSFGVNGNISLTVNGGTKPYQFNWSNNESTQDLKDLIPGTYTVTVTDGNGCTNIQTYEVQNKVGVNNPKNDSKITISPNPFTNELRIESFHQMIYSIEILDLNGKQIYFAHKINDKKYRINLSTIPSSYYMLRTKVVSGKEIVKIIQKK